MIVELLDFFPGLFPRCTYPRSDGQTKYM